MSRNSNTTENKAALARVEAVLSIYPQSDCAPVNVLADLKAWAEEHDLEWRCLLDAADAEFLAAR